MGIVWLAAGAEVDVTMTVEQPANNSVNTTIMLNQQISVLKHMDSIRINIQADCLADSQP